MSNSIESNDEILALIKRAVDDVAPGKVDSLNAATLNVSIRELGIDSVASMEMVSVVEEEIGVTFPDDELAGINTLADLVNLVRNSR